MAAQNNSHQYPSSTIDGNTTDTDMSSACSTPVLQRKSRTRTLKIDDQEMKAVLAAETNRSNKFAEAVKIAEKGEGLPELCRYHPEEEQQDRYYIYGNLKQHLQAYAGQYMLLDRAVHSSVAEDIRKLLDDELYKNLDVHTMKALLLDVFAEFKVRQCTNRQAYNLVCYQLNEANKTLKNMDNILDNTKASM